MPNIQAKNYETIFILDSILEDDKAEAIKNKYEALLTKNGAQIIKSENWGRKKFANAINKKVSGFYISIDFTANPDSISKLEKAYHIDENILRFLTVNYDKKTLQERNEHFEKRAADQLKREQEQEAKLAAEKEAAENPVTETTETKSE